MENTLTTRQLHRECSFKLIRKFRNRQFPTQSVMTVHVLTYELIGQLGDSRHTIFPHREFQPQKLTRKYANFPFNLKEK